MLEKQKEDPNYQAALRQEHSAQSSDSNKSINAEKRQSSLRSLKELQNRKKINSFSSSSHQQTGFDPQTSQKNAHQFEILDQQMNNSMHAAINSQNSQKINLQTRQQQFSLELKQNAQRQQYRSLLESSIHSQQKAAYTDRLGDLIPHEHDLLPSMVNQEASQKSMLVEQALRNGGSLLRKRSPSQDILRRKSTPVTPKQHSNGITVPQALDQNSFKLIKMAQNRNGLNLSTVQQDQNDIRFFPSLSQTPKFDIVGGVKVLIQSGEQGNIQNAQMRAQLAQSLQPGGGLTGMAGTQDMRHKRLRISSKNGSRSFIASESKSQSRIKQRQGMPGGQAWLKANANMFQVRDAQPLSVLQQLQEITASKFGLSTLKPQDLDSTEPLDSFIDSLYILIENYVMTYNDSVRNKLQHLATGVHTSTCEDLMNYLCQLQYRNKVLLDSVEYFADHIVKLGELEQLKLSNEQQIRQLRSEKEEVFLQRVDIDRKYSEALQFIEQQKRKNQELSKQAKQLNIQLEKKSDECESLQFRLRNMQDLDGMLEPPNINQTIPHDGNGQSSPAAIDVSPTRQYSFANEKLRGLEAINKKLEDELNMMRNALERDQESKFQENVAHLVKIQELFNKVQIENKTLRVNNGKLESKLESKEKLISHLETKVTTVIVEKEEVIIKLKSEIVILKNLIEMNEKKFDQRIHTEQEKVQKRLQAEFKSRIKQLEVDKEDLSRENSNLNSRLSSLQEDYAKLSEEHAQHKERSIEREQELQTVLVDLEGKLKDAIKLHEDTSRELQSRIESLENVISVQAKQISIQDLKLKFIRESTENLLKQKNFLVEDLTRSHNLLSEESVQLQIRVNETNPSSSDYLISVKKALSQSRQMLHIGLQALSNIGQIAQFLKIEELLQMIIEQDSPSNTRMEAGFKPQPLIIKESGEEKSVQMIQRDESRANREEMERLSHQLAQENIQQLDFNQDRHQLKPNTMEVKDLYNIQEQSNTHHITPVAGLALNQFMNSAEAQERAAEQAKRDETYFLVYCPIELSSILIKTIADLFSQVSQSVNGHITLPPTFEKLLHYAASKSDISIEQEILSKFINQTKQAIEERMQQLVNENDELRSQLDSANTKLRAQRRPSHRLPLDNNLLQPVTKQNTQNFRQRGANERSMSFADDDEEYNSSSQNTVSPKGDTKARRQQIIQQLSSTKGKSANRRQSFEFSLRNNNSNYNVNVNGPAPKGSRNQGAEGNKQDMSQIKENSYEGSEFSKNPSPAFNQSLALQSLGKGGNLAVGSQESAFENNQAMETSSRLTKRSARKQKLDALQQAQNEVEQLKVSLQEQKQRSKDLQLQLASKIVLLEEQLEDIRSEHKKQVFSLEEQHKQEAETSKAGVQQRESQLVERIEHYKHRIKEHKFSSQSLLREIGQLKAEMQAVLENVKHFDQKLSAKDEAHERYKLNVQKYINLRTSQRNVFAIALESSNSNMSMINESMLKYYLNKCLKLDKEKFRFLAAEEQSYDNGQPARSVIKASQETVLVNKLIIEIIDDQENFDGYFKMLKNQIRDGSCLLYDLEPLYVSINLGQTGLNANQLLQDYHIIFKKGVKIQNEEFLLTVLRHTQDAFSFKVMAMNFCDSTTGTGQCEEYLLDLNERDLLELTEGQGSLVLQKQEPRELVELIVSNLVIIHRDQGQRVLACEHKVFFNSLFHQHKARQGSIGKQQLTQVQVNNYTQGMNSNNFRNLHLRDQQIKQPLMPNQPLPYPYSTLNEVNPLYQSQMKRDCEVQVNLSKSTLVSVNDQMITSFLENQRVGKHLEFKIHIQQARENHCTQISFEEIRSKKKIQLYFITSQHQSDQQEPGYMIHTEVLRISEAHTVLISMERVQKDGLFVKLHSLKDLESKEFFLLKKSNQAYSKLERHAGLDLIHREDFRNLVYDLTFATNIPSKEVLMANVAFQQEQHFMRTMDFAQEPYSDSVMDSMVTPPARKRTGEAQVVPPKQLAQKVIEFRNPTSKSYLGQNVNSVLFQKQEKGGLLYRNVYVVRCVFEGQEQQEQQSIISFFQKRDVISIEVFLYKDAQKMSIASQASAEDLFSTESHSMLSFSQQVLMLDQMMERLYVLSENQTYHLKVENEATPISSVLERRKLINRSSTDSSLVAMKTAERVLIEGRCREIQGHRELLLSEQRSTHCHSYMLLSGKFHNFNVYFLNKSEREGSSYFPSSRKKNSILKKMFERQTTNLDALIEDTLDYDTIYVEVIDQDSKQVHATALTQKSLSNLIQQNPYEYKNTIGLISNRNKDKLAEFLKLHTRLDGEGVSIENKFNEEEYLNNHYKHHYGGMYLKREDRLTPNNAATTPQAFEAEKTLSRKLVVNQEIDMSEFTYDLKLFLVTELQEGFDEQVIAYSFEVFALNDPDVIYVHNQPAQSRVEGISVPAGFGLDVINLIENPIKQQEVMIQMLQDEEATKKQNFQDLFAKYIDSRLIITVSEVAFPWKLSYCIIEPCSRLTWTYGLDTQSLSQIKQQERLVSQGMGNLEILSYQDFEKFLALNLGNLVFMDYDKLSKLPIEQFEVQEGKWLDLGDNESRYEIISEKKVADAFSLTIAKIGKDCIEAKLKLIPHSSSDTSSIEEKPNSPNTLAQLISQNKTPLPTPISNGRLDQTSREEIVMVVNTANQIKLQSQVVKTITPSIQQNLMSMGLAHSNTKKSSQMTVQLLLSVHNGEFMVQLVDMDQKKVLYVYKFTDLGHQPYQTTQSIDVAIISALRVIVPNQTVDKALYILRKVLQKQQNSIGSYEACNAIASLVEDSSVKDQMKRFASGSELAVVLHRKTFFDDTQEKLIIVSVEIQCPFRYKKVPGNGLEQPPSIEQECEQPVEVVLLKISEPETDTSLQPQQPEQYYQNSLEKNFSSTIAGMLSQGQRLAEENAFLMEQKRLFELELRHCFHEEELRSFNLRNISHLKRLAKLLIEERAIINRVQDATLQNTNKSNTSNNSATAKYKIDINVNGGMNSPSAERRLGAGGISNEDSPDTSSATGLISGSGATQGYEAQQQVLQDQRRAMESLRKANNVSANGQRKHHDRGQINEVIEDDRELEEDEDSKEETKESNKPALMGPLTGGQTPAGVSLHQQQSTKSGLKQQHQILEQSVIEEEGSQEENDDTPHKFDLKYFEGDEVNKSQALANSIQQQSIDAKSVQEHSRRTPHVYEGTASINNSPSILYKSQASHLSHQNIPDQHAHSQHHVEGHIQVFDGEGSRDNDDTESLKHTVEKTLPKDYRLEVGVKPNARRNEERIFVAVKKSPNGDRVILQREFKELDVMNLLGLQLIEEGNIASVVDDLSDLIADNLSLLE